MTATIETLRAHQARLRACRACPRMIGPPVTGEPVVSKLMLVGQAPGPKEVELGRPFAWTAGKTLFGWLRDCGLEEEQVRRRVYMAAVCRCFPGKRPGGGDRVPGRDEIAACAVWREAELRLLRPTLIVPVGKLAIGRFVPVTRLDALVGRCLRASVDGVPTDLIPLPHPSGASVWHRTEPGRSLLKRALETLAAHPTWRALRDDEPADRG